MRIALLGAGRIGQFHARLLSEIEGIEQVIVADAAPDRAREVAAGVGALAADSLDDAMNRADAVVIAASTNVHADLIRGAIGRRIPTFCEKPLAVDLEATLRVASDIDSSGVSFQLGFQRRFDAGYREARRMVETGEIGTLYVIRLAGHDPEPPHDSYIPTSGGLFRDLAIHDFDILRFMTGSEVEEVYADGGVLNFDVFARYDDVDTAVATFRLANGSFGVLTAARHDPLGYDVRAEMFGSRDSISVGLGPRMPLRSVEQQVPPPVGPAWSNFLVRFEDAYRLELQTFVRLARGEIPSPCTARDGVEAMRIAEAATLALREHRMVGLSEIAA
jgi:myo-inositol 2-dehydrogenase/D-chiro-inositol 1-dehydrogenase